jgi:hypothetical protein
LKNALDISDHTTKYSCWALTMMSKETEGKSTPATLLHDAQRGQRVVIDKKRLGNKPGLLSPQERRAQ